ncbi:hypothetical protein AVEN_147693-1 [Araneus ventricosus]|uniref:Uncharacterized protein n=1 Tax=Araneus ventricosus TaxID=182803 RepID=A0A4Y2X499_ARAVE|nr:hypothetical protein AVEN_228386-1 [Araneus ventricosus]GBO43947.1 hypothetical protein AVEN_147693-1 [Araneus ventricosus]
MDLSMTSPVYVPFNLDLKWKADTKVSWCFNSIDTVVYQTTLQAKDGGGPKRLNITGKLHLLSLNVIDFTPRRALSSLEWLPQIGLGKRGVLRIRTVPVLAMVYERGGEFSLSLKKELGRSRTLRYLYSNRLRNQRFSLTFSVEKNASPQMLEIREIIAYDGKCNSRTF